MAKNKKIIITTPKGAVVTQQSKNGSMTAKLEWNPGLGAKLTNQLDKAQCFIDSEVLRLTSAYVPFQTGALQKSGILGTDIGSGEVKWIAPYAAAQYYNTATSRSYDPKRGAYYFERMKIDHGAQIIAKAKKFGGGK